MKTCWSWRDTCCISRKYVKDGTNSQVISQDSFIVIHNRAECETLCFIRTLVLVSSLHFASLELLWIIEIVWVWQKWKRKITTQKPCVWISYKHFHAQKNYFWSSIWFLSTFPHILGKFHGPGATFLHALGMNCIPRIRNKLFTDVLIAIVSQFLCKPIRSILLIKVWITLKVYMQYLNL